MLYRPVETTHRPSLLGRVLRAFSARSAIRRQRLAELELLSMNDHLKRDVGLDGNSFMGRR